MTVYAFGLEEHSYFNAGGHKGDLYYYSLGGRLLGSLDNNSKTMYYLTDALGSVLASFSNVANSAAIKGNQVFGPYGNARDPQGSINTAKGFTGQYTDSVSGLDYYGSRYYDQVAGVFLSADIVQGNGSGENPYGYVGGNPETKNDPSGQIGLPPVTTQPPATSNPLTWPKLQIPPEEPAPVEVCFLLCPTLGVVGVVGIATVLAIGLFFLTSPAEHLYDPQRPVFIAAYLTRSSEEFYGSNDPTQLTFQPHSSPPQTQIGSGGPQTQTGGGGQGIRPPIPTTTAGDSCSFTADTHVATDHGERDISKLQVGDKVLAYNPSTHKMELRPIQHVWTHYDNDLIDLTITTTVVSHQGKAITHKSEVVHTTSEHPFLTTEQGFVPAGKVKGGMHILRADGSVGVVIGWKIEPGTKVMYNLEVAQDHTFNVGDGQWVVHNHCGPWHYNISRYKDPSPSGFQNHHGVLNVWAESNIEDYSKWDAPTMVLNEAEHNLTRSVFANWRIARTGSLGGYIDWQIVSPQEIQDLAYNMFDAAGVPAEAIQNYFQAFNQYIYNLP